MKTAMICGFLLGMFAVAGAAEVWPDGSAMDVGKQETRAVNVVFRNCNVKGKENVKLDPSFMKLEGYVPPAASPSKVD